MSTVMYAFRAKDDEQLREQIGIMKFMIDTSPFSAVFSLDGVDILVFYLADGIVYRVLEPGYGLKNMMWKHPKFFPPCNYDDRTEISEEDEPNEVIARLIDHKLAAGEFAAITVIEADET